MPRQYEHDSKLQKPIDVPTSSTISFSLTYADSFDKMVSFLIIDNRQSKEAMP